MKCFRYSINVLLFTTLFITTVLIAKKRKTTTTAPALPQKNEAYQKAAAKLPAKTYKQLLDDIRIMKPKDVINEDGILTDSFVSFIIDNAKKANLSPILTKSLLQAGLGLHAQLSNDNKIALQALSNNKKQIENILATFNPPSPQPKSVEQKPEPQLITPPLTPISPKQPQSQPKITEPKRPQQPIITKTSITAEEVLPPSPQTKPTGQQPQLKGIADLQNFREQSATKPMDNFYANNKISTQWLEKALRLVLDGAPLTSHNKDQMQGELVGTATELMREFLEKNKTNATQRSKILDDIKNQVIIFMNAQRLQDQSPIQKPSITHKTPGIQPVLPQQKKSPTEPISDPKKIAEDADIAQSHPIWLSDNGTVLKKEFEIEILNYIFKHRDASENTTLNYFVHQLPTNLKNKDDVLHTMKTTLKKIFPESEKQIVPVTEPHQEVLPKKTEIVSLPTKIRKQKLPTWINKDNLLINVPQLKSEITSYFAQHTDADNEEIINHFVNQVPDSYPNRQKLERQVKLIVESIFSL
jgi:hypothetical protein